MLPVEEFDSPAELRERFELLCGTGAPPGRFRGVMAPRIVDSNSVPGKSSTAMLHVPQSAPFFADHFPRRPVFPATLLLDSQIRLALRLAADVKDLPPGTKLAPVRMTHVKMRSFIAPGDVLELAAEWAPSTDGVKKILLSEQSNVRSIATARLELASGEA
jgi:3-hydroxymyristoyl/3-hydroxydecanoyl-(acyl carrier protein) dehydratase